MPDLTLCDGRYTCVEGANALVILTEWDSFRALDFGRIKGSMKEPLIVDFRNVYASVDVEELGFSYSGVGRGKASKLMPKH